MSDNFAKVIELYQPSEQDLKEKQDKSDPKAYPKDLNLLPLAILCPELGKVIACKGSDPDGPQRCC